MRSLVGYGKFLQCHADVSKVRIVQPVDFTGQEDALQRDAYVNMPAVEVTVCINHCQTLYWQWMHFIFHNLPWGRSVSWRPSFYISLGSPGLFPTQLCTSLYLGAFSWTSVLPSLSFSHVWAASSLDTHTHTHTHAHSMSNNWTVEKNVIVI